MGRIDQERSNKDRRISWNTSFVENVVQFYSHNEITVPHCLASGDSCPVSCWKVFFCTHSLSCSSIQHITPTMSSVWYARLMNKDPEPPTSEYPTTQFNNSTSPLAMLGNLHNQQQQQQPPQPPQQAGQQGQPMLQQQPMQQQQQQQPGVGQQNGPMPPPPPLNGQDQQLSNILYFLQSEWRRYERDRNEWEVERAELRVYVSHHTRTHYPTHISLVAGRFIGRGTSFIWECKTWPYA